MRSAMARLYLFRIPLSSPSPPTRFLSLTIAARPHRPLSARCFLFSSLSPSLALPLSHLPPFSRPVPNRFPSLVYMDDRRALRSVYLCLPRSTRFTHFFSRPTVCH